MAIAKDRDHHFWEVRMKRVLIVDDAAFMRVSIKNMLSKHGYEVVGEAENGKVAVHKFQELAPDIVTMDITMPEMNGLESLKAILALQPSAQVVMISAMGQESMVREAVMAGARGFIVKPFKEDVLISALSNLS
jgi:two-component system chemotaxis response regulator CheY